MRLLEISPWQFAALLVSGFVAGGVNAVAGGGTVISFPILLWIGVAPVTASATNTVALWPGMVSGAFGFRRELATIPRPLLLLVIPALVGGTVGALILIGAPPRSFEILAPYLVLLAAILLALRERIASHLQTERRGRTVGWWAVAVASVVAIAIYGGYFGAGIGIMLLATLGLIGLTDIHEMNGVKNLLTAFLKGAAIVSFAVAGKVFWGAAAVMGAGSLAGGLASAWLVRRVERHTVRRIVVAIGVALALSLLFRLRGSSPSA